MFYFNHLLYWSIIASSYSLLVSAINWKDDLENNNTLLTILEEMITRQKFLNQLDGLKSTIEQLHLRPSIEDIESRAIQTSVTGIGVASSSIYIMTDGHCGKYYIIPNLIRICYRFGDLGRLSVNQFRQYLYGSQILGIPSNCAEATACTKRSGYYKIQIDRFNNDSFLVECDVHTDRGPWTVIQRRQDGSMDFFRPWSDYKAGFGDIDGEFFIGLDKLHAFTNFDGPQELMILMENANGTGVTSAYAKYDSFAIGGECDKYVLKRIGKYSGTAGDSLQKHIGCKFSTKDQDNDNHSSHCAETYHGGWWYNACHWSNLNGHYGDVTHGKGLNWYTLSGHTVSLKYVKMMIRRRKY